MSYIKVNVDKPTKQSPGKGGDKKNKITIVDLEDVLTHAARDSKGIVITGKHVFKPNAYAITLYVTPGSHAAKVTSDGETDEEGFNHEYVFNHPGELQEIMEFRSSWLGRDVLIFDESCSDNTTKQYGSPCAPLRMKVEGTEDKDSKKSVFTFASTNKGPDVAIYKNTLTLSEPVATVAADAVSVDLSSGEGEYQLTDNTGAKVVSDHSNGYDGLLFSLIGSGGTNPSTIATNSKFLLHGGTTWTALSGSTISFKLMKFNETDYVAIEQSRT